MKKQKYIQTYLYSCKYGLCIIIVSILFSSCNQNQITENNETKDIQIKTAEPCNLDFVAPLVVKRINKDSLPVFTPGKNGMKPPRVVKAGNPVVKPNTGIHGIIPGFSNLPQTKEEILTKTPLVISKLPPKLKYGDIAVTGYDNPGYNTPFIKEHSNTVIPPKSYKPGTDTLKVPVVVKVLTSDLQNEINPTTGDTLKLPVVIRSLSGIVVPALPPRYKDNAISNLKYFDVDQGMKSSYVLSIIEDKSGNLWFGTDGGGVSRYDGETFTHFTTEQGLSNNYVRSILEDKNGNIWFGTDGGGVNRYDGRTFTHFTTEQGLSNNVVLSILEDKDGNLWFGTNGGGVCRYDGAYEVATSTNNKQSLSKTFTHFTTDQGLSNDVVWSIVEDKSGNLWFGTFGGGVSRYDGETFTHFTTEQGLSNNVVLSILEDKNGNLWFGTFGGGVSRYDADDGVVTDTNKNKQSESKIFTHFTTEQGLSNNYVCSIIEDKSGNLWFGTSGGGVCRYDGDQEVVSNTKDNKQSASRTFTRFTTEQGLSNNVVWSILEDKSGNFWFGTDGGGVSRYGGETFTHYTTEQGLISNVIWSILEDKSGNLWFGTDGGGVCRYNGANEVAMNTINNKQSVSETFAHYSTEQGLSNNAVFSILEDRSGNFWFGTNGDGVCCFKGANEKDMKTNNKQSVSKTFTYYTKEQGLSSNVVWSIFEDKSGNIWFGTDGGGVNCYDPDGSRTGGETFTHYTTEQGLSNNVVLSILEDKSGNIWFGTNGGGVCRYDGETFMHFTKEQGLSNNKVKRLYEDKHGNLWIATSDKVTILLHEYIENYFNKAVIASDKGAKQPVNNYEIASDSALAMTGCGIVYLGIAQGLSANLTMNIMEDKSDNIWIGCEKGPVRLSPVDKETEGAISIGSDYYTVKVYTTGEGFIGGDVYSTNSVCEDSKGNIWWGSGKMLTKYNPKYDVIDNLEPKIHLKNIRLFFEDVVWSDMASVEFDGLTKWFPIPENLSLPYDQNHVTFNYIGINWSRPDKIMYQFMLEGSNKDWSPLTNKTEATFSNLPHGTHTFKVKAVSNDGVWSETLEYKFEIRPPWWKTWWFRTIYIIMAAILLIGFYLWRTTALRKRQKELVKKVREATVEINEKNEELKQLVEEVTTQKDEITAQRDLVTTQKEHIEEIHKEVSQSINYAELIQRSILPDGSIMRKYFAEFFVLFKPRDIVSGDFYWATHVEGHTIVAAADCTGHGVPGAFMSMLGISFLREIVQKEYITHPGVALRKLRKEIIRSLKQKGEVGEQKDGMDMALISINHENNMCLFSGANNPLYLIRNNELIEYKPDKMPIAIYDIMNNYTVHEIQLEKGDLLYMFSDGYADQFGGPKGKKFMYKRFKELLVEISQKSLLEQKEILNNRFSEWQGSLEQIDDVVVVGLRI